MQYKSSIAALAGAAALAVATPTRASQRGAAMIPYDGKIDTAGTHVDAAAAALPTEYSSNWGGVIANKTTSPITDAYGCFIVPSCGAGAGSGPWSNAYWVGIDGTGGTKSLVQAGVTCSYTSGASGPTYYAWTEYLPNALVEINNFPVSTGDQISVNITVVTPTKSVIVVEDYNKGNVYTTTIAAPTPTASILGLTAEWIAEDLTSGGLVPFASFKTLQWTSAFAYGKSGPATEPGAAGSSIIDLVQDNQIYTSVSLSSNGVPFNISYTNPSSNAPS